MKKSNMRELVELKQRLKDATLTGDMQYKLMRKFARSVTRLCDLMVVVYDDFYDYPHEVRMLAGCSALRIIRSQDNGYLPEDISWCDPEEGRSAYLASIAACLPELSAACVATSYSFDSTERHNFYNDNGHD